MIEIPFGYCKVMEILKQAKNENKQNKKQENRKIKETMNRNRNAAVDAMYESSFKICLICMNRAVFK